MSKIAPLVLLGTLAATAVQAQAPDIPACGVELRIRTTSPVVRAGGSAVYFHRLLVAELVNTGGEAVSSSNRDGGGAGWRTPTLRWQVTADRDYTPPPGIRCGNINPLRAGEVFSLLPGSSRRLNDWVPPILGVTPGRYRLRLSYVNDPALKWRGLELAPHPEEMQRVRESTPCRVESNEITLTVLPEDR